jgi:NAD-dependent DNA ligase
MSNNNNKTKKVKRRLILEESSGPGSSSPIIRPKQTKSRPLKVSSSSTLKNKAHTSEKKTIKYRPKLLKTKLILEESQDEMKEKSHLVVQGPIGVQTAKKKVAFVPIMDEAFPLLGPSKIDEIDLKIQSQDINMNPPTSRYNEKYIDMLDTLSQIMTKKGETFRARAYQKAQETIMGVETDVKGPDDLKGMPAIGKTIMEKLKEYTETGTLKIIEKEKTNPVNIFSDIYGVGPKKAEELVTDHGIKTIDQLRTNDNLLNDKQRIGLKYYEDIKERIPRSEIDDYKKVFEYAFDSSNGNFEIVGSYRRGLESSGDIDVIITSDDESTARKFIDKLIADKIIVEVLSRGAEKCLVIAKLPGDKKARRVDFLYTAKEEYPFAVLYFTGSKIFNTVMRNRALQLGYSMNEHGLRVMDGKKKGAKVAATFGSEEDIFKFLGLVYKMPQERTDGRSVIINTDLVEPPLIEEKPLIKAQTNLIIEEDSDNGENIVIQPLEEEEPVVSEEKVKIGEKEEELARQTIRDFQKTGLPVLEPLAEKELVNMLETANVAYRNTKPIMTDAQYDILQEHIESKYPDNATLQQIGAPIERNKAQLPYFMGSMDKIKPNTTALANWIQKYSGPYIVSCKLDGVSGLYTTEGVVPKLYTRGDGTVGQDVSHFIPHLRLPKKQGLVLRGEFIMPKNIFEKKYKKDYANARNLVSGIINRLTIDQKIKDVRFVAYEVIVPELKPGEQMALLSTLSVDTVMNQKVKAGGLSNEVLSVLLVDWRKNYDYEIDGIIVTNDLLYKRSTGNPAHSVAFKMVLSDQVAEAKVTDVIWKASKDGYLKPTVRIEPISLGGVTIEYATGFNGAFISDNKIGVGAVVEIIRSGDVIPYIKSVTVAADVTKMPDVPFVWNSTHVDVILEDAASNADVREKNIAGFFKGIGVDGLGPGNVSRIISAGYDSVPKIIKMKKEDFSKVEGFKDKMATKIYDGIQSKIAEASLITLMGASNTLGRGISEKKMEPILDAFPDILTSEESPESKVKKVMTIKGMAAKSAELFVGNIPMFIKFMQQCGLEGKLGLKAPLAKGVPGTKGVPLTQVPLVNTSNPLYQKMIVMTGFRSKELSAKLKAVGAKEGSSVSKNTFVVLLKDKDEDTAKANEARKLGIPLMTPDEFSAKYFV